MGSHILFFKLIVHDFCRSAIFEKNGAALPHMMAWQPSYQLSTSPPVVPAPVAQMMEVESEYETEVVEGNLYKEIEGNLRLKNSSKDDGGGVPARRCGQHRRGQPPALASCRGDRGRGKPPLPEQPVH